MSACFLLLDYRARIMQFAICVHQNIYHALVTRIAIARQAVRCKQMVVRSGLQCIQLWILAISLLSFKINFTLKIKQPLRIHIHYIYIFNVNHSEFVI